MKIYRILAVSLLSLSVISCVQEIVPQTRNELNAETSENLVTKEFTVSMEPQTKGMLDGTSPIWEVNEQVSVYDPIARKERIFIITEVKDRKAVIKGEISDGDFAFSAVYPASCVGEWTDIENCTISIPTEQTIKKDRNIDAGVLASRAYSADGKNILFKNAVSLLRFQIERDDIISVSFKLLGDTNKSYSARIDNGVFEKGKTYHLSVDSGEYKSGIEVSCTSSFETEFTKSSKNTLTAKLNGILNLGVVSDGVRRVSYTILGQGSFSSLDDWLIDFGLDQPKVTAINGLAPTLKLYGYDIDKMLPIRKNPARTITFEHKSIDANGKPVTLSAFMIVPEAALTGAKPANGFIIANHTATAQDSKRPSGETPYESGLCWMNYALVMSDYLGLGSSYGKYQAFLNPEVTARNSIDAYQAAAQILADLGASVGSQIYNFGYSQGGHTALANIKYVAQHPELGISFTKSFVGGAPSDVIISSQEFMKGGFDRATVYMIIALVGFIKNENIDLQYSDVFQEPLLSNIDEWVNSLNYSTNTVLNKIGTNDITKILTPEVVDSNSSVFAKLLPVLEKYSMNHGSWTPPSGSTIRISHSSEDMMVPFANLSAMENFFNSQSLDNCSIDYIDLVDVYNDLPKTLQWALNEFVKIDEIDHVTAAGFFALDAMTHW